ncbi:MAG TPA: MarR family winged helix-turn-helix transcriptional regulator [Nitrospiraceae bacterium]|nr:MarR family winged helix-turn-helix transcriptional regulator [Nitrospiraceae bacterium]
MAEVNHEPLQNRIANGLSKIALAIKSRAWREGGNQWLPPLQAQTLRLLLKRVGHDTPVSLIAQDLAVTMPTVSEMLRVLMRKGMIKRVQSKDDHRVFNIELTAKGKREASRLSEWPYLLAATQDLSQAEQVSLLRATIKVIRSLQDQGEISTARMCVTCRYFRPHAHQDEVNPHHCEYVDAAFGDHLLRVDCSEHQAAPEGTQQANWSAWLKTGS